MKKLVLAVMVLTGVLSFGVANQGIENQEATTIKYLDHGETI
ncbi:hypothetical protein [Bacillus cereus group sp. BfR-BA-01380]|nr:hypothetical protein [Bacillus cereus group sp. BfR-BA-01380]